MFNFLKYPVLGFIRLYQICFSPFLGQNCRYYPSCSRYMHQAITRFGLLKGGYLGLKRLLSCHPDGGQGVDYVPERFKFFAKGRQYGKPLTFDHNQGSTQDRGFCCRAKLKEHKRELKSKL